MARFYKSELTVSCESNARSKNFIGILLSIVVLVIISSMIVAAIVIINPEIVSFPGKVYTQREAITLEESFLNGISPNTYAFQWVSSSSNSALGKVDELLFEDSKRNLKLISLIPSKDINDNQQAANNTNYYQLQLQLSSQPRYIGWPKQPLESRTLVANTSLLSSVDYQGFKLSPSKRYLLIWTSKKRNFRHSCTAKYFLYDIKLDLISMLSTQPSLASSTSVGKGSSHSSVNDNGGGGDDDDDDEQPTQQAHNSYEHLDSATHYLNVQDDDNQYTRFQLVDWFQSRDENENNHNASNKDDSLILIQNNDIFLLSNVIGDLNNRGQHATPVRLTHTGKANEIYNGVPDWLYEEEILGDTPAFEVSPFSSSLAYITFNDSLVELMPYTVYGPPDQVIPKTMKIRYPKAGRVNPRVSVHVVDKLINKGARKTIELSLPEDLARRQHYINRIRWLTRDKLGLIWLNRNQNESHILICSRKANWRCEKNLHFTSPGGWLDISDDIHPLDENHYLALILKHEGIEVGSFKHIAKVSLSVSDSFTYLTEGRREIMGIEGVNEERSEIYFVATPEDEPGQRQLFSVRADGSKILSCITCDYYPDECLYNYGRLSPSTSHYIFQCDGPGVPRTELRTTTTTTTTATTSSPVSGADSAKESQHLQLANQDLTLLWTIEDNQELKDKLTYSKAMPITMRLKVPITGTNYSANVIMLLPPQLGSSTTFRAPPGSNSPLPDSRTRPRRGSLPADGIEQALHLHLTQDSVNQYAGQLGAGQQYPMVVEVYAGPGSLKVDYRFNIDFGHYLASSRRTIYAYIDGRGSANQGTKRLYEIYHKFGSVEIRDQIDVAAYLTQNFSFIDPNKVATWGWSYGGYASAMALAQSNLHPVPAHPSPFHYRQADLSHHISASSSSSNNNNNNNNNGNNNNELSNGSSSSSSNYSASGGNAAEPVNKRDRRAFQLRETSAVSSSGSSALLEPPPFRSANSNHQAPAAGVFECAVSVAPVTNWIYYDTAYTERFMSSPYLNELYDFALPGDHNSAGHAVNDQIFARHNHHEPTNKWLPLNQTSDSTQLQQSASPLADLMRASRFTSRLAALDLNERYKAASLLERASSIDKKRYLLIHGTADDNVHFQQSIMLMKKLIQKNVLFETRLYPDQDHSINNKADKLHLGTTLSNFFAECFDMAY